MVSTVVKILKIMLMRITCLVSSLNEIILACFQKNFLTKSRAPRALTALELQGPCFAANQTRVAAMKTQNPDVTFKSLPFIFSENCCAMPNSRESNNIGFDYSN